MTYVLYVMYVFKYVLFVCYYVMFSKPIRTATILDT